jgi:hypothetical protein
VARINGKRQLFDGSANFTQGGAAFGRFHSFGSGNQRKVACEWLGEYFNFDPVKSYEFEVYDPIPNIETYDLRAANAKKKFGFNGFWSVPVLSITTILANQFSIEDFELDGYSPPAKFLVRHGLTGAVVAQLFSFLLTNRSLELHPADRIDFWISNNETFQPPTLGGSKLYLSPDPGALALKCASPNSNTSISILKEQFLAFTAKV